MKTTPFITQRPCSRTSSRCVQSGTDRFDTRLRSDVRSQIADDASETSNLSRQTLVLRSKPSHFFFEFVETSSLEHATLEVEHRSLLGELVALSIDLCCGLRGHGGVAESNVRQLRIDQPASTWIRFRLRRPGSKRCRCGCGTLHYPRRDGLRSHASHRRHHGSHVRPTRPNLRVVNRVHASIVHHPQPYTNEHNASRTNTPRRCKWKSNTNRTQMDISRKIREGAERRELHTCSSATLDRQRPTT